MLCSIDQELQANLDYAFEKFKEDLHEQEMRLARFESKIPDHSAMILEYSHGVENAATKIRAEFVSMKEQMKNLIEENNATPMDLMGFLDDNCTKLWDWIPVSMPSSD